MPIFQKPLGWVQRFFYNVEQGSIPAPVIALSLDQDWPLDLSARVVTGGLTIAGSTSLTAYTAPAEKHAQIIGLALETTGGGSIPGTDATRLNLVDPSSGIITPLALFTGITTSFIPFVGGGSLYGIVGANEAIWRSIDSGNLYVPPGWRVTVGNTSVAGGINFLLNLIVLERLRSYPLRIP